MRIRFPGLNRVEQRSLLEPLAGIAFVTIVTLAVGLVAFAIVLCVAVVF